MSDTADSANTVDPDGHDPDSAVPDSAAGSDLSNDADHADVRGPHPAGSTLSGVGLLGLGLVNATCLVAGLALGLFVDSRLGTAPVFVLVGMASGIVLGILGTIASVRRFLNN